MRRYAFSLFFLMALILGLSFEPIAQAIPNSQEDCEFNQQSTSSQFHVLVPCSAVTVNNGDVSRKCIIQFSTEAHTTFGDLTTLRYTIDSTNPVDCTILGPTFFHTGTINLFDTATSMIVVTIGPGTHTIRPCFNAGDINGGGATSTFFYRCLTVECRTQ